MSPSPLDVVGRDDPSTCPWACWKPQANCVVLHFSSLQIQDWTFSDWQLTSILSWAITIFQVPAASHPDMLGHVLRILPA